MPKALAHGWNGHQAVIDGMQGERGDVNGIGRGDQASEQ